MDMLLLVDGSEFFVKVLCQFYCDQGMVFDFMGNRDFDGVFSVLVLLREELDVKEQEVEWFKQVIQ